MKKRYSALVLLFVLLSFCHHAVRASQNSGGYRQTQVDGITSKVVDTLWSRTDFWWHSGDYPRIIAEDRIITEADQGFLDPYATGGWLMESMGDNVNAEKYYRLGATRNPNKSFIWYNLGFFYYNTLKNYPKAVETFLADVKTPDASVNDWKMLAHSYERNKQLDKAVATWEVLHARYPADQVILNNLTKDQKRLAIASQTPPDHI